MNRAYLRSEAREYFQVAKANWRFIFYLVLFSPLAAPFVFIFYVLPIFTIYILLGGQ